MSHWYTQDGKAQHFQPNGKDTTLREARKDNLLPSVTGILDILDKPGLNRAAKKMLIEWCADNPYADMNLDLIGYAKWANEEAFSGWTAARDRGSEIHNCMEAIFSEMSPKQPQTQLRQHFTPVLIYEAHEPDIIDISGAACAAIVDFCDTDDFISEQIVVGDGYGGAVDLYNDDFVIDMKSKDITDKQWDAYQSGKDPRIAYPENCMQLSAYDEAISSDLPFLGVKPRRLINVYIDRQEPGRIIFHEWQENMYDRFMLLVKYWQMDRNYYPEVTK